jgi:hypothetical protein
MEIAIFVLDKCPWFLDNRHISVKGTPTGYLSAKKPRLRIKPDLRSLPAQHDGFQMFELVLVFVARRGVLLSSPHTDDVR